MNPAVPIAASSTFAATLFAKQDTFAFAVLSGAAAPDLVKNLFKHEPEYCCLYRGELAPDMAAVAPYLVRLEAGSEFTAWLMQEGWGARWGIFATSGATLRDLRNHFRQFHLVELPDQRTVIFRYYDPRVLRTFLPPCNAAELTMFFGPLQSFLVEDEGPDAGVRFSLVNRTLKTEPFELKKAQAQA